MARLGPDFATGGGGEDGGKFKEGYRFLRSSSVKFRMVQG